MDMQLDKQTGEGKSIKRLSTESRWGSIWVFTVLVFQLFCIFENFQSKIWGRGKLYFLSTPFLLLSSETTPVRKKDFHHHHPPVPIKVTHDLHIAECSGHSPTLLLDLLAVFDSLLLLPLSPHPHSASGMSLFSL